MRSRNCAWSNSAPGQHKSTGFYLFIYWTWLTSFRVLLTWSPCDNTEPSQAPRAPGMKSNDDKFLVIKWFHCRDLHTPLAELCDATSSAFNAVNMLFFCFTWDAQVDGRARHILSRHLIHSFDMVTPCIRCSGCQDNQLIVQSDCSAGHK